MSLKPGSERSNRRARALLALGAAVGITLAATGILDPLDGSGRSLPAGVLVRVNETLITEEEYTRSLHLLATDKRNELTDEDRRHVLKRLIEQELLIQRGVEIGLVSSDPSVRKAIAAAMIQSIVGPLASLQPEREELERFHAENLGLFTLPARFRVQEIVFRRSNDEGQDALSRAEQAERALERGTPFETVRDRLGDRPIVALPDAFLPPHKLREYLGPTLARAAMTLDPGQVTEPLRSPSGVHILRLVEAGPAQVPPIESILDQVESEFRRRAADQALRDYLDWLADEADLVFVDAADR
jgi:hypothetical protein